MKSVAKTSSTGSRGMACSLLTQRARKAAILGATALTPLLFTSSGALAQICSTSNTLRPGFQELGGFAAATAGSVAATIGNVHTAFLTQQGSAFVAQPSGAPANSPGGGVWARGVGGEVELDSTSQTRARQSPVIFAPIDSGNITCANREHETFAGIQVGSDIARLNWFGWNFHLGTTAGYLSSNSRELLGTLRTGSDVTFAGTYLTGTYDRFFFDVMVKGNYYNFSLNNPAFNLFNEPFAAHGLTVSGSVGYNFPIFENWFVEPSAGFIWDRTRVDTFNAVGLPDLAVLGSGLSGTFSIRDIESELGRLSIRVGTSFVAGNLALQPFFTASVFHEFAGDIHSNYTTCAGCVFVGGTRVTATFNTDTTRVGTYGQYSLGIAGQLVNTGWVGFVRGDYRIGENIEGWTANAGLRYHFTPEAPPVVSKDKGLKVLPVQAVNWTGFYVGGFAGADQGRAHIRFVDDANLVSKPQISGFIGGGQAGYNYQWSNFVVGVEGDIGATTKHGGRSCGGFGSPTGLGAAAGFPGSDGFPNNTFSPFFLTCNSGMDWIAMATGRLGLAWERTLFYVKGGGAWTNEDFTVGCIVGTNNRAGPAFSAPFDGSSRQCFNQTGVFTNGFRVSDGRGGWVVGFGSEFALTRNWSAKAEYNYIDFGSDTLRASDGSRLNVGSHVSETKIGVNYRWN